MQLVCATVTRSPRPTRLRPGPSASRGTGAEGVMAESESRFRCRINSRWLNAQEPADRADLEDDGSHGGCSSPRPPRCRSGTLGEAGVTARDLVIGVPSPSGLAPRVLSLG